ncbi:MAG: hypothetical protein ACTHLZ_16940 [Tepidisphaeraceae bacterium]
MLSRFLGTPSAAKSSTLVEDLEGRQLMAAQVLPAGVIGIKIAKVSVDGLSNNTNRITVAFNQTIRLKDTSLMRSFGYANNTLTANGQRKVTVGMTITQPGDNYIQIITDRLIRKGSRLFIYSGAITNTKNVPLVYDGTTSTNTITFAQGQNKPRYTLSNRAFKPTDLGYVSNSVFSGAPTPTVVSTVPSSNTVAAQLSAFLDKKVAAGTITAAQKNSAINTYNSATAIGIIPDANLRAALVSLTGTVAASAIDTYLGKANVTGKSWAIVTFDSSISASAPTAETKLNSSSRLQTIVRPTLGGESFVQLSAILAREAMHQQSVAVNPSTGSLDDSLEAEVVDNTVAMTVYAQQLLADPTTAGNGTTLSTYLNTQMVAFLNSGSALFPYGGINAAPLLTSGNTRTGSVFLGSVSDPGGFGNTTPVTSFADFVRRDFIHRGSTPNGFSLATSPYAQTVLANITGKKASLLTKFNQNVDTYLDTSNTIITDVVSIKMAQALKLTF